MSENSGTDARFPYEHRQNVVVRFMYVPALGAGAALRYPQGG